MREGLLSRGAERKPVVTWTLLAVNVLVWLIMEGAGGSEDSEVLLDFGAMFGPLIADGEFWRLFTAMFLHVGLMHLLFNAFGLFIFGRVVERIYGPVLFTIIYVVAGLSGSVASYLLNSIVIGAGASGAIFGVLGALAAFLVATRDVQGEMGRQNLSGILVIAAINLFFGFATPGIDNWAHMGGFVGGFALGMAFAPRYQRAPYPFGAAYNMERTNPVARRWWVLPVAVVVLVAGTQLGTSTLPDNPYTYIFRAERLLKQRGFDEAFDELSTARDLAIATRDGRALAEVGKVLQRLNLQNRVP